MDKDTVQYLADLARIDISEDEKETFAKDLQSIIGFVDQIQKVEIKNADTIIAQTNVFRDDIVAPIASNMDLIEIAPSHQDGFVKVPKVIE